MSTQWTIHHVHGQPSGQQLIGYKIEVSSNGQNYQFTTPNNTVLATTPGTTRPQLPFDFPQFSIPGGPAVWNWNIHVETLTAGRHHNKAEGTWSNNANPAEDESGTFTAQAGQGMEPEGDSNDEGKEDAAAASAY